VKLCSGHWPLKLLSLDDLAEEGVCVQEHRIVEEDVVDANYFFFAQNDVRRLRVSLVH
jgi:hypothetical protein